MSAQKPSRAPHYLAQAAFLAAFCYATAPAAFAVPYQSTNISACFAAKDKLDLPCIDTAFHALETVARNWPPKTDSAAEKQRAAADALKLHEGLLAAIKRVPATQDLFLKLAWSAHLGYNLDAPGMGPRANELYKGYLGNYPGDVHGNFLYGVFLSGVNGSQRDAVPYLEKALAGGEKRANMTLALAYVGAGEKDKAKTALEAYLKDFPGNEEAIHLMAAVESGGTYVVKGAEVK